MNFLIFFIKSKKDQSLNGLIETQDSLNNMISNAFSDAPNIQNEVEEVDFKVLPLPESFELQSIEKYELANDIEENVMVQESNESADSHSPKVYIDF